MVDRVQNSKKDEFRKEVEIIFARFVKTIYGDGGIKGEQLFQIRAAFMCGMRCGNQIPSHRMLQDVLAEIVLSNADILDGDN